MLTLTRDDKSSISSILCGTEQIDELLEKEWLLTNDRGGYACGTVVGCNTRRYHGLLVGSLNPPVNRIVALSGCLETVIVQGKGVQLSTFEFEERLFPQGWRYLQEFQRDIGVHFKYKFDGLEISKSVYLDIDSDTVAIVYEFTSLSEGIEFVLRPFVALRDFHTLQKSYADMNCSRVDDGLLVRHNVPHSCELFLRTEWDGGGKVKSAASETAGLWFEADSQWWFNFFYRREKQRGQDDTEDLWSPGFFKCAVQSPGTLVLWAQFGDGTGYQTRLGRASGGFRGPSAKPDTGPVGATYGAGKFNLESLCERLRKKQSSLLKNLDPPWRADRRLRMLSLAAEQFVVKRQVIGKKTATSILAGFPWFADWGRDALMALPGLLICTGRLSKAGSVLMTFAEAADEGMVPNRFDDYTNTAHYNSIDASLWFIHSAFEYLKAGGEDSPQDSLRRIFSQNLLPVIRWIIECYYNGTKFGIHADADGLITGGSRGSTEDIRLSSVEALAEVQRQLTWMDAKYQGKAFTPRHGKAVEVNALWYSGLCRLAEFYRDKDIETAKHYGLMAEEVAESFCKLFWNDFGQCLYDCVGPDGSVDASLRPNQIFAVSLPFSALSDEQQKKVVDRCEKDLLTPYGLRTLSVADKRYEGSYAGPQEQRDQAYHQGTVWPHLIGPFIEAYLKVNGFSRESKKQAMKFITPLLEHLVGDGCIASISEIFDGDAPHKPRGCIAQAWAVGELLRLYQLLIA